MHDDIDDDDDDTRAYDPMSVDRYVIEYTYVIVHACMQAAHVM